MKLYKLHCGLDPDIMGYDFRIGNVKDNFRYNFTFARRNIKPGSLWLRNYIDTFSKGYLVKLSGHNV